LALKRNRRRRHQVRHRPSVIYLQPSHFIQRNRYGCSAAEIDGKQGSCAHSRVQVAHSLRTDYSPIMRPETRYSAIFDFFIASGGASPPAFTRALSLRKFVGNASQVLLARYPTQTCLVLTLQAARFDFFFAVCEAAQDRCRRAGECPPPQARSLTLVRPRVVFMPMPPLQMCVHALQLAVEAERLTIDVGLLLTE
jgi:hypothetical protein